MKKIILSVSAIALAMAFSVSFASAANYSIMPSLTMGSTGSEVVELQQMLVAKGYLVMPAGVSYGYFGTLTKNAVIALQSANGISPAAGYYGPVTAAKVNSWSMTGGSSTGGSTSMGGGDGDFREFDVLGNPDSTDIEEGATEEVFGFEFEAKDSDLAIERVDALFGEMASNTDKPWKVLEEVSLSIDGEEVASVDASDSDNWSEEENDEYSVRFEDFSEVVKDGDKVKAYISVTAQDNLDTADLGTWNVELMQDGVRALNGDDRDVYEGGADDNINSSADERDFTLEVATIGDLTVSVDDDQNKDKDVAVDEDADTNDVDIYIAQVESQDGDNNIEEVTVSLATTSGTTNGLSDIVKTLYLFIDGEEVGSESVSDDDGAEDIVFENIDVTIDEDEEVDFEVKADIDNQDGNYATTTTGIYVSGISIDFVDAQDDDQTETDTTDGGDVNFSVDALTVELATKDSPTAPLNSDESVGEFYLEFEVTAPEDSDIYIAKGATTSTTVASGQGAEFIVVDGNGNTVTATTTASSNLLTLSSGGSEVSGSRYKITKGNTATFLLDVIVANTGASADRTLGIQLTGVNFKAGSNAVADTQFTAGLDYTFRSKTANLKTANISN